MMKIQFGLVLALVAITMTGGCLGMPVPEIKKNLDKLFSADPNDALTLEQARNVVMEVGNMRDESMRSENLIDGSTYDDILELYAANMEHVCDPTVLEEVVHLESKYHDKPNVMLVLQRPRSELSKKCQQDFMERIAPGTFNNENPAEWQAISKIVHSTEPTLLHTATNGHQLESALRHTVTQTMKTFGGFENLFDWFMVENNVRQFRDNLCLANNFAASHVAFGEYLGFDREKSFLKGLSGEQEDQLIRSLVCDWLRSVNEYGMWDSYLASQMTIQELYDKLFTSKQELNPIEVHMILRVISKYDKVSDEKPNPQLDEMKRVASNLLLSIDYPECSTEELNKVIGLKSMRNVPNVSIEGYHNVYIPAYMKVCKGRFPKTSWFG